MVHYSEGPLFQKSAILTVYTISLTLLTLPLALCDFNMRRLRRTHLLLTLDVLTLTLNLTLLNLNLTLLTLILTLTLNFGTVYLQNSGPVLASDSSHKTTNVPSLGSLVLDAERIRPGQSLGRLL